RLEGTTLCGLDFSKIGIAAADYRRGFFSTVFSLISPRLYSYRLSSSRLRAGAYGHEAIHLGSKINVRLVPGANHRVVHDAGFRVDAHALKNIERARHIIRRDVPWFHRCAQILPAAVIGNLFRLLRIDIDAFRKNPLRGSLRHHLEALTAAHPLLQIVPPFFERI